MKRIYLFPIFVALAVLMFAFTPPLLPQSGQPVRVTNIPNDSAENAAPATPPVPLGCRYRAFGSLPTITNGDMAYIGCNTNGILRIQESGDNLVAGQVSIGTSATQVVAVRVGRAAVGITSPGTQALYCGPSGVTSTTGQILPAQALTVEYKTTAAVFCVVGTGTMTVSYAEVY